jgi:hypothetical protein
MHTRTLPFLLLLLALSAQGQQPMMAPQSNGDRMWAGRVIRPEPARTADLQAARVRSIHQDAQELSALEATLQAELQLLQKGMLHKDLASNLKKVEKLSKKTAARSRAVATLATPVPR